MSISFAAPPVIRRTNTPPHPPHGSSPSSQTPHAFRTRHNSQSSLRSSFSEKSGAGTLGGGSNNARRRANSSPPPDGRFTKRVSFDTFTNPDASIYSLTLKMKHKDYKYTRRSRTFLIGFDNNEYSTSALEWLIDTFADDGDEIIALRVIDPKSKLADEATEEQYRLEARRIIDEVVDKNEEDKAISIIIELAVGNVKTLLMHMIHLYHPDSLIVGTRGRSLNGIAGVLPGSMSKWCLQNSPIPVIVVRPDRKRNKMKSKRQRDPNRRSYLEILEKTSSFEDLTQIFNKAELGNPAADTRPSTGSTATAPPALQVPVVKVSVPESEERGRGQTGRSVMAPSVIVTSEEGRTTSRSPAVHAPTTPSGASLVAEPSPAKPKRSKSPFGRLIAKVT